MNDWLTEGVSSRSPWGITNPVIHLLLTSADNRMWCSGGPGRPEVHHSNSTPTGRRRLCRECRALAQTSVDEGTLNIEDPKGWRLREPVSMAANCVEAFATLVYEVYGHTFTRALDIFGDGRACSRCVDTDAGLVCQTDLGGQCGRGKDDIRD